MANLNACYARSLLWVFLMAMLMKGLNGKFEDLSNTIQVAGSNATLFCSSLNGSSINWLFTPVGGENDTAITVVAGCKSLSDNYTTESPEKESCNLVINNLTLYHAGRYTCNDNDFEFYFSAQLGVITSPPECILNTTGPVVEGQLVYYNYNLTYHGSFTAYVLLKNIENPSRSSSVLVPHPKFPPHLYYSQVVSFSSGTSASIPRYPAISCITTFISDPSTPPYLEACNNASYRHESRSEALDVLYRPYRSSMNFTGGPWAYLTVGTQLTCTAPANPAPSFRWTDHNGNITEGPVVTLSVSGLGMLYSCHAWNSQGNATVSYYFDVYKVPTTPTVTVAGSPGLIPSLSSLHSIICLSWIANIFTMRVI